MGDTTGIAWTDRTWNPWQGCHKVSEGCANCYMFREKHRYGQDPGVVVRSSRSTFNRPLSPSWSTPAKVFVCSWSDFFIEDADAWRAEAWDIIRRTPHLTYQILTKRPERIYKCLPWDWGLGWPNVWLGITGETQRRIEERELHLYATPVVVRFLSYEPAIKPIIPEETLFNWFIVGGESGPGRRNMPIEWAEVVARWCRESGTACYIKQLHIDGRVSTDPAEWPEHLRVRQFPRSLAGRP